MSAEAIIPVHLQQHTPAPLKAILNAIHNSILWLIPLSLVQACVHHTHTHTHTNKGGAVLIAFCPPLKGRPPGSCSPSIGFIMAAVHPSSCCFALKTWICLFASTAGSPVLLQPWTLHVVLACLATKGTKVLFPSTNRPASCLYFCPQRPHLQVTSQR